MEPAGDEKQAGLPSDPVEIDETAMFGDDEVAVRTPTSARRLAGDVFGRYRILKTLGEGAMGSVYLALDTQLNRKVALKIPKVDSKEDARFLARFLREARSAATLSHPNICPVYDVGEIDGTHFLTMAYVQGHPLSEYVNPERPQRERNVAYLVRRIALALHEAHINGLVHRDVKPANIMIDQRNEPIVMDFGLARGIDDSEDARLTRDGAILGSPAYMSPEQIEGKSGLIGPASDIYGLGVILYELLTGQLPFQGSVASIIGQIVSKQPEHPCRLRADLCRRLGDICMKALAKKPADRYVSMKDLAADLAEFLKSIPEEGASEKPAAMPESAPAATPGAAPSEAGDPGGDGHRRRPQANRTRLRGFVPVWPAADCETRNGGKARQVPALRRRRALAGSRGCQDLRQSYCGGLPAVSAAVSGAVIWPGKPCVVPCVLGL